MGRMVPDPFVQLLNLHLNAECIGRVHHLPPFGV
jgi:hypothetical protein